MHGVLLSDADETKSNLPTAAAAQRAKPLIRQLGDVGRDPMRLSQR
jgi:hypothetical protein